MREMDIDSSIPLQCAVTDLAIRYGLEAGHEAVMDDVGGCIPQVPLKYFMDYLLPPLPPGIDVERVKRQLKRKVSMRTTAAISGDRWTSFKYDPSHEENNAKSENAIFAPFAGIAKAVAQAAMAIKEKGVKMKLTAAFYCNPNRTPASTNRTNTSRPDGYAVLKQPPELHRQEIHWDNIVIPGEKKKHSSVTDINDNNAKIIWSLKHCMRETVQRRFVFGYTIEDASMRLWFCSRADLFVSEQFNFITDHDELIYFFLSVMFARRSQLGYDPTINASVALGNEKKMYDITVRWLDSNQNAHESTYRTLDPLANVSVEAAQGRGTRVWKGREIDKKGDMTGNIVVVKDYWVDDDRTREGDTLAAIRQAAQASDNPLHKERFDRHFLHVVCHGDVYINGEKDNTFSLMRKSAPLPSDLPPYELKRLEGAVGVAKKALVEHSSKTHCRIMFLECGETIDKLTSVKKICKALHEANTGLLTLHELGWIHRDISAGNILVMHDDTVKITDLEYSKRHDDDAPVHHGRTGTYYFVPVEIQLQEYMFAPPPPQDDDDDDLFSQNIPADHGIAFKSNPLHDLESLWWLSLYLTISRRVMNVGSSTSVASGDTENSKASAWINDILTHASDREVALRSPRYNFDAETRTIHKLLQFIARGLNAIRSSLETAYIDAERNLHTTGTDTSSALPALHSRMSEKYSAMLNAFTEGKVTDFELSSLSLDFVDSRPKAPPPPPPYSLDSKLDFLPTGKRAQDDAITGIIKRIRSIKPPSNVGHDGDDGESIPTSRETAGEASLHEVSGSAGSTHPTALHRSSRIASRDEARVV
ncbi:hypothetical protein BDW22DRAFT_1430104 [Trametopsis cervina]|nr:hypothetical protein BDW22DRAFT_1430104 [Trametopsis cervina]